jgi:uncharacterized protein (TIGR00251 family)
MAGRVARLTLKVIPGASSEGIAGWLGPALKIRVRAPAERGKANAAVEKIIAKALGIPSQSVQISSGKTSARKTAEIEGLSIEEVLLRLPKVLA